MRMLARLGWALALSLFALAATAQPQEPQRSFSQAELDQMLAPIALYPDSLLSQILMAATYPRDVYEAASWSRANDGLRGESAVRAVENEPWDPSVISLVAFPQVLAMMDERRGWTERLGDAYLAQPEQVMDTVQQLRARADAAGNLRTTDELIVQRQGEDYVIESPTPEVVYVPYYDPRVVYGSWWWRDYDPVYWSPWAGYSYYPGYGLGWGYGISLGRGFFFGGIDWRHRYLRYSHHRPWYYRGHDWRGGHRWTPDRDHRWRGRWQGRDDRHGDRGGRWSDRDNRWRYPDRGSRGQDRDRDGRWRDHDRDGRRGRDDRRDGRGERDRDRREWRGRGPNTGSAVPQEGAQGFFGRDDARTRAVTRPAVPAFRNEGTEGTRPERVQRRENPAAERPSSGLSRAGDARAIQAPRVYQAPVQQAPVHQAPVQQQRVAPAPRQSAPPQPVAPQQGAGAPSSRTTERPDPPAPAQRSGGRGVMY